MKKEKAQKIVEVIAGIARVQGVISVNTSFEDAKNIEHNSIILAKRKKELEELLTDE